MDKFNIFTNIGANRKGIKSDDTGVPHDGWSEETMVWYSE